MFLHFIFNFLKLLIEFSIFLCKTIAPEHWGMSQSRKPGNRKADLLSFFLCIYNVLIKFFLSEKKKSEFPLTFY